MVAAVVLWDLPAIFARGLREALTQAGCAPVVIAHGGARPVLPAPVPDRATVVIAPAQTLAGWEERSVIDATVVATVAVVEHVSVEVFAAAIAGGAVGVIEAATQLGEAAEVVAAAAAALVVVPDHVAAAVADTPAMTGAPALGEDERCWLRWLAGGKTVTSLAVAACYSEREMYRLLRTLYTRLGASGRTEALLAAQRYGLLDD